MELVLPTRSNRTIMTATMAVFMLGLALSFSTWRNLRQQQESFHEHALVTARSIAAGIEINLRRELRLPATSEHANSLLHLHRSLAKDLLQDYVKRTDARFIGLYNPLGHILISSHNDPKAIQGQLPTIAWASMGSAGEWSGEMNFEGQPIMVLGRMSHLTVGVSCPDGQCPPDKQPPLLLIGVDMTRHLEAFGKYKRTAILQTGYILAVTVVFWILLLGFLQRNEQRRRLQHLESFNARLLDNMPDGLLTLAADGKVVAANPAAADLMGGQGLVGQPLSDLFATLGLATDIQPGQEWTALKAYDRHLEILQLPLKDGSGQSLMLVRDRTELAELERELHRNEKLAAIGRMAAGVAHEIRNPLSALRGFAQFFAKKLAGRDPEELYARTMVQEADRLNRVITDLLFLARPRQLTFAPVPVAEVFADVNNILYSDAGVDVETGGLVMLTFDNGTFASIDCSWSKPPNYPTWGGLRMELVGENGLVTVDPFKQVIPVYRREAGGGTWAYWGSDSNQGMIDEFAAAIREDRAPSVTGYDGYKAVEIALAVYRSAATGQPVRLAP